jgi:hypothetical protein
MWIKENRMARTPLEEIEAAVHEQFGARLPTKEEAGEFLHKRYPTMDGGIVIAIALAALALQGWQVYRCEQELRRQRQSGGNPPKRCPECGEPETSKNADGKSVCINGHPW